MKSTFFLKCTLTAMTAAVLSISAFGQNLVSNGSFESEDPGVVYQTYGQLGISAPPTGWTFSPSDAGSLSYMDSINDLSRAADYSGPITPADGDWFIAFGAYNDSHAPASQADYDSLSQTVQTAANTSYSVTYSLYELGSDGVGYSGDYFNVTWDGQVISGTQVSGNQYSSGGWLTMHASVQGDGNSHTIAFNGFNDTQWTCLDNVSLVEQTVPEPSSFAALGIGLVGFFIKRRK